jgi:glyoxylase-like metal-dependent hydrolase (beta-lactamase superfamily II)
MKIYFLSTGFASVPLGLFVEGMKWKRVRFPILSVLIEREGELILFDTGMGERIHDEMKPVRYWGNWFFLKFIMKTEFDPVRDPLIRQIPALGLDPKAVKYVVISHLHWDHAGGILDFPDAKFFISKKEWDAATAKDSHKHAYIAEQYNHLTERNLNLVTMVQGKPFSSFSASYDIFGDGQMVFVDLPGHTKGLMGMILTMPSGRRFLFGGDSIYFPENLEYNKPKSKLMKMMVHENPEADRTLCTLHELAKKEPELEMVGCHDHRIPGRYELAPFSYEG